jgi:hypothetical protein
MNTCHVIGDSAIDQKCGQCFLGNGSGQIGCIQIVNDQRNGKQGLNLNLFILDDGGIIDIRVHIGIAFQWILIIFVVQIGIGNAVRNGTPHRNGTFHEFM